MVMVFHFVGYHGEPPWVIETAAIGQSGVELFFVLSGFLITRVLLLSRESPHFFKTFYVRRALRIFPLYYGFLVIFYFVLPALGAERSTIGSQWWTWFFLSNIPATFPALHSYGPNQFWSLAVEEHFYLLWPLAVHGLSQRQFRRAVGATLIVPPVLRLLFLSWGIEVSYFTLVRLDAIGYGALLAILLADAPEANTRLIPFFRCLLLVLPLLLLPLFGEPVERQSDWMQAVKFSLIPAFYFALCGFCIVDPAARRLTLLLSSRWLRRMGAISFGLYVFHPTCFALVTTFAAPTNFMLDAVMSFGLTILVAFFSFRFFEQPILRFKRRFEYLTPEAK